MNLNPYQAPVTAELSAPDTEIPAFTAKSYLAALMRWIPICAICAIPSFMLGMQFAQSPHKVLAMAFGVLSFAFGFAALERTVFAKWKVSNPRLFKTLWIGYGTRVVVSFIFPIGAILDMFLGMASTSATHLLLPGPGEWPGQLGNSVAVFVTTLIQGLLINVVLIGFMGVVYGIQTMAGGTKKELPQETISPHTSTDYQG